MGLSKRESECIELHEKGKTTREISELVKIGLDTVRYHIRQAKNKRELYAKLERKMATK